MIHKVGLAWVVFGLFLFLPLAMLGWDAVGDFCFSLLPFGC